MESSVSLEEGALIFSNGKGTTYLLGLDCEAVIV